MLPPPQGVRHNPPASLASVVHVSTRAGLLPSLCELGLLSPPASARGTVLPLPSSSSPSSFPVPTSALAHGDGVANSPAPPPLPRIAASPALYKYVGGMSTIAVLPQTTGDTSRLRAYPGVRGQQARRSLSRASPDASTPRPRSKVPLRKAKKRRGAGNVCHACGTTVTPEWRKGPDGPRTLCNACGLHYMKKKQVPQVAAPMALVSRTRHAGAVDLSHEKHGPGRLADVLRGAAARRADGAESKGGAAAPH